MFCYVLILDWDVVCWNIGRDYDGFDFEFVENNRYRFVFFWCIDCIVEYEVVSVFVFNLLGFVLGCYELW